MSKTYLLSEKYKSAKGSQGEYFGPTDNIRPSVSNSFIKKQSTQARSVHPTKHYQHTMPLGHSKKVSEIKMQMDSSVALPKIVK
jgi:hypothetical protein